MRRKLVQQGPSTLTVSVPKPWADRLNLKNGDEVDMDEIDNKLVLSTDRKIAAQTKDVDCANLSANLVKNMFIGLYRSGAGDIRFINCTKDHLAIIYKLAKDYIGYEIVSSGKRTAHVIDVATGDADHLKKLESQIYWKLLYMIDKVIENPDPVRARELDLELNRITFFLQRQYSLTFSPRPKTFLKFLLFDILEEMGDGLRDYARIVKKNTKTNRAILMEIRRLLDDVRGVHANFKNIKRLDKGEWTKVLKTTLALPESTVRSTLYQILLQLEALYEVSIAYFVE